MSDYEAIWACFLSGQMEESDIIALMRDDADFSAFAKGKETVE